VWDANNNGASLLKSALCFPIGLTMRAEHVRDNGSKYDVDDIAYWEENVTLGVQNVCFFRSTGVPVLPQLTAHSTLHPPLQHLLEKYEVALCSNNDFNRFEHKQGYKKILTSVVFT